MPLQQALWGMTLLAILIAAVGLAYGARKLVDSRALAALTRTPPERVCFEVSLPVSDGSASPASMTRFWAGVVHATQGARRRGTGQVDLMHVATGNEGGGQPTLKTYLTCDPSQADRVRRELAQHHHGSVTIRRVPDPLRELAQEVGLVSEPLEQAGPGETSV